MTHHDKILITIIILVTGLLMLSFVIKESSAGTIFVDDDTPDGGDGSPEDPYNKIQDAIDAGEDGDTIIVSDGEYFENVVVNKSVTLIGGGESTKVIGEGVGYGIYLERISNVTIGNVNVENFEYGIMFNECNYSSIVESSFVSNTESSIYFYKSYYNSIDAIGASIDEDVHGEGGAGFGIYLEESAYNNLSYIFASDMIYGIRLDNSNYNTITDSTISNNKETGIYLYKSDYNNLSYIVASDNRLGIKLKQSDHNILINNNASDNDFGITPSESNYNTITDNIISNNIRVGLSISKSDHNTITDNIALYNKEYGIYLSGSDDNNLTDNNASNNNEFGIYILNAAHGNILTRNTASNNDKLGIYVLQSSNNIITDNIISNNQEVGVFINGILSYSNYYANNNTIKNNNIFNNKQGIRLQGGDDDGEDEGYSDNNIIIQNLISNNSEYGLVLYVANENEIYHNIISRNNESGIYLWSSNNSKLTDNDISDNNDFGIYLRSSNNCDITDNVISGNNESGISLSESNEDRIFNNTVIRNKIGIYSFDSFNIIAHNNNIYKNTEFGINSSSSASLNATYNWWGHKSGPYHPIENLGGIGDNITKNVIFDPWLSEKVEWPPVAYLDSITPNPALMGDSIQFQGHGTGKKNVVSFVWRSNIDGEFYNGTESNCTNDSLSLGEHNIYFKVQDDTGNWSEEVNASLVITAKPIAIIESISPYPGLDTDDIHFKGNGIDDGTIWKYVWRTDDVELYNGTEKEFLYSSFTPGTYSIYLKVMDNYGKWSEEVNTTLMIHERPIALINLISPNPGLDTDTIHFSGNGTDDGTIERFAWRADDVEIYNSTNPEFSFSDLSPGTYMIFLKVQDNYGIWSEEVDIKLTIHEKPIARIDLISPDPGIDNEAINFSGIGTDDETIERYAWRTDDGELYYDTDSEFSYSSFSPGNYTIYLKVQDNHGVWSEEVNVTLIVHERPVAEIVSISPSPATEGDSITFTGNGADDGSITRYLWRADELELYNGTNSSFTLFSLSADTHIIYLRVQDNNRILSDEVNEYLVIYPIIIPNKIPTVSITAQKDGDTVKGIISINGTSADEDGIVEKVEISINKGVWKTAAGTESWNFEWNTEALTNGNYTIRLRCYDGQNYSNLVSIIVSVDNKDNGGEGSEGNFLFEEIGPLLLIGYIGIVLLIGIVLIAVTKKGKGKTEVGKNSGTTFSPPPSPAPSPPPAQLPQELKQQQSSSPPTQPPQQASPQQSVSSQGPQPDVQSPSGAQSEASMLPEGAWTCHKCKSTVESNFNFCTNCGSLREK